MRSDEQRPVIETLCRSRRGHDGAQAPPQAIANDGRSDGTTDGEADVQRRLPRLIQVSAPQGLRPSAATMAQQCLEVASLTDPTAQAESRARPLRRRALRMARPDRVRMRARNPCLRARRRVFGWKVRFTRGSDAVRQDDEGALPHRTPVGQGYGRRRRSDNRQRGPTVARVAGLGTVLGHDETVTTVRGSVLASVLRPLAAFPQPGDNMWIRPASEGRTCR